MPCPGSGQVWGGGWWGQPGLSCDICVSSPWQVDFTSCPGLFCVLGIVVMVTGIVTAIVLSFKYVSSGKKGAVKCYSCLWLGVPWAGMDRGVWMLGSRVWCQPRQRQLACRKRVCWRQQHLLSSCVQASSAMLCLLPDSTQLTLPVSPSLHRSPGSTCCMQPLAQSPSPW